METTRYILGTYNKAKYDKYCTILSHFAVTRYKDMPQLFAKDVPYLLDTATKQVYWSPTEFKTYYLVAAEVYTRDVAQVRKLAKLAKLPTSFISEHYIDHFSAHMGLEVAA